MILLLLVDLDNAIAKDGEQILFIPEDLKRFKERTQGHVLVMGRKTFEATGTLPHRETFVMTRREKKPAPHVHYFENEDELERLTAQFLDKKVYLVGGAGVVKSLWHCITEAYLTRVAVHTGGDTRIPSLEKEFELKENKPFTEQAREEHWVRKESSF